MDLGKVLLVLYVAGFIMCTIILIRQCTKRKTELDVKNGGWKFAIISFVTNFFDTWGIGSFAPTIIGWKFLKAPIKETEYGGSLNFGFAFPVAIEAILFNSFVDIDGLTLFLMVIASALGSWVGVGIVSKLDIQKVRVAMAICLACTAVVLACKNAGVGPFGSIGTALSLQGWKLIVGIVVNFFLGALMMIGFGLYIPCTALVALLGMSIGAAFPIMMGSCTLLMVVSVPKWAKMGTFNLNAVLIGGIFGSFGAVAAYLLLKYAFDLHTLAYLMCVVMVYTAVLYIRDVMKAKKIS